MTARTRPFLLALLAVAATAALLLAMGRVALCTCGFVSLWGGGVDSAENSQQIADWYSLSHIIHGFIFWFLLACILPRVDVGWRFLAAVMIESAWELLENSPIIIDRYRQATIAIGYTGDSVLNSVSDIAMMTLGFWAARKIGGRRTLLVALLFELLTLVVIRDNLALNILMLAWPLDAVRTWQAGA